MTEQKKRLVRADTVADALAVDRQRVYELWRLGLIPGVRLGKRQVRFDLRAVLAALGVAEAATT